MGLGFTKRHLRLIADGHRRTIGVIGVIIVELFHVSLVICNRCRRRAVRFPVLFWIRADIEPGAPVISDEKRKRKTPTETRPPSPRFAGECTRGEESSAHSLSRSLAGIVAAIDHSYYYFSSVFARARYADYAIRGPVVRTTIIH